MYLLGLGLLVLRSWYLIKLYNNFNNDQIAKKEIDNAWQESNKEAKGITPFARGELKRRLMITKLI